MEGGNVERVRCLMDAFNRRDLEEQESLSTDDLRIVPLRAALENTGYSGPHAIRDFWEEVANEWTTLELDLDEFTEEGDRRVGHGMLRGTARSSTAHVEVRVTTTCTFREGLVAEIRVVPDGG